MKLADILELLMVRYIHYQVNLRLVRNQSDNESYIQLYREESKNQAFSIIVSLSDIIIWLNGAPINRVFPHFNTDQEKFLTTGVIPEKRTDSVKNMEQSENSKVYVLGHANKKSASPVDCTTLIAFTTQLLALNAAFEYVNENNGALTKVENALKGEVTFKRLTYIKDKRTYSITISPLELRGK